MSSASEIIKSMETGEPEILDQQIPVVGASGQAKRTAPGTGDDLPLLGAKQLYIKWKPQLVSNRMRQ